MGRFQHHQLAGTLAVALVWLSATALAVDPPQGSGGVDAELESLRPGLVAVYRSLVDAGATLARIDAKPAFTLGHSSPHPRLPPGPFEVEWKGVLLLKDAGPLTFEGSVCGEVTVTVDGVTVLAGRGERETAEVGPGTSLDRPPGIYRLAVRYRSLPGLPARLHLRWQGPGFARESLPAWHLQHVPGEAPSTVATEQEAEKGRLAIGRLGCARCHRNAFPAVDDPPPGPSLADAARRLERAWLLEWLADPAKVRPHARMPALFAPDRTGLVERWLVADHLLGASPPVRSGDVPGDHRLGQRYFQSIGCTACHFLPETEQKDQPDFDRTPLTGLRERLPARELAAFLGNPHTRYPDGRMPRLSLTPDVARDVAAYLHLWSPVVSPSGIPAAAPSNDEIDAVARRLGVRGRDASAVALVREKGCVACHTGLGPTLPADVPLTAAVAERGCLSGRSLPRYTAEAATRKAIAAYQAVAARERHASPYASRQRLLDRLGCWRCHQRDSDRAPPLEVISSTLGGSWLQTLPFLRTPRLTYPLQKYTSAHLATAIREGVSGLRYARYTYQMPCFGADAETVLQALAEADGELPAAADPPLRPPADPTLATLAGPTLAGFQGYACVSCHPWNGQLLTDQDPGAVGTDLTRVAGRIRRDWFDRYLEGPGRSHPGTPMPAIFTRGKPATLASVLEGDPAKQKEALWSYFLLGKQAPSPKPPPPQPLAGPVAGEPALVAQIPVRLPDGAVVEGLCLQHGSHDLVLYDVGRLALHSVYTGARLLRGTQGRLRTYTIVGTPVGVTTPDDGVRLLGGNAPEAPAGTTLDGFDRLADGVRIRWQAQFEGGIRVEVVEDLRLEQGSRRGLLRAFQVRGIPAGRSLELRVRVPSSLAAKAHPSRGDAKQARTGDALRLALFPDREGLCDATLRLELPPPQEPPPAERVLLSSPDTPAGALERPGYRAVAYPRPKTAAGEDLVMPSALAISPRDGRVFIASMKQGELFTLDDPTGDGTSARFVDYARGYFQDAYALLAEADGLYVLHRRNLTKVSDTDGDGRADRFDRVAALAHGVADTYDYAYGLVRDAKGAFVFSYAPHANRHLPGSGSALRLVPGLPPQETAYGFRNPLGWCNGPQGSVFFTDNQGEWVATNKLCHLVEGRFYGYPNTAQPQHASKPRGRTALWVPYAWARSINGVTRDTTEGKFGPFAGQFFLAELMFGGAILRADLETVNGEVQGACFPFWGQGLLGPVVLAFDPRGRLFVGSITEPTWMAQPDRGALFRIDFTGQTPFEMQTIRVLPRGFRVVFTRPVAAETARDPASYRIESYRYEYTGAYGSPELDRARLAIERVEVAADGRSADLVTGPLVPERVYLLQARGVRSPAGEPLVHPVGAYTLNEVPHAAP